MFRLQKLSSQLTHQKHEDFVYSVAIGSKKQNETIPRRHPKAAYGLLDVEHYESPTGATLSNLGDLWESLVQKYSNKPLLGEMTFSEADHKIKLLGTWLINNGHEKMYLYCKNSPEWSICDITSWSYGTITIPLYDTLGNDAFKHIIKLTEGTAIFTTSNMAQTLHRKLKEGRQEIKEVVFIDYIDQQVIRSFQKELGIKVTLWSDIMTFDINSQYAKRLNLPLQTHLTYSFTSGTTGLPKGVICTHRNALSQLLAMHNFIDYSQQDVHLSYLPIAHIFERYVIWMCIYYGCNIQYCEFGASQILKDLQKFKPTVIPIVPRILNKLYPTMKKIYEKQPNGRQIIKMMFGGKLRTMITASAPVSAQILTFFKKVLECEVREAYGQTQTTALSFVTNPLDTNYGYVGGPNPSFEVKLISVPEMNYLTESTPPKGQICLRGPSIFTGYYKDDQNTSENLDSQGWSHTGDIGSFMPNGSLKIIDRKKNIYKLSQGQYVAPQKVENTYIRCEYVAECFIYGDSMKDYNIAIIHPNVSLLSKVAEILNIAEQFKSSENSYNVEKMCESAQITNFIFTQMQKQAKKDGLFGFQTAKKIKLWPLSLNTYGIFTSTMKLQRHIAKKAFKQEIEKLYQTSSKL